MGVGGPEREVLGNTDRILPLVCRDRQGGFQDDSRGLFERGSPIGVGSVVPCELDVSGLDRRKVDPHVGISHPTQKPDRTAHVEDSRV